MRTLTRLRRNPKTTTGGLLALVGVLAHIGQQAQLIGWWPALVAGLQDPTLLAALGAAIAGLAAADAPPPAAPDPAARPTWPRGQ